MSNPFQNIALFSSLNDEQRGWLQAQSDELTLDANEILFSEGDPSLCFHIVVSGLLQITKRIEGRETEIDLLSPGMFTGDIGLLIGVPNIATARALQPTHLLVFGAETFQKLITMSPAMGRAMLPLMGARVQGAEVLVREREKMAALGKMSAGLSHELNNPAAAGRRAADQLRTIFADLQSLTLQLAGLSFSYDQQQYLARLPEIARENASRPALDALELSDQEYSVLDWLEKHSIEDSWELAPTLVNIGFFVDDELTTLELSFDDDQLNVVVRWLVAMVSSQELINAVSTSATRISELVDAVKSYSHMDEAPLQEIDVHESLDSTLKIMEYDLRDIVVTRDYDRSLPHITAYGSELNQVWTNLIDNAADAMRTLKREEENCLLIRTACDGAFILVEIVDNGPGIAPDVQNRIFQPFFTTKSVGEGTGLGLDISYRIVVNRHFGDIRVQSVPGETRFQVRLPTNGTKPERTTPA
jgi:signal transduction histidine kinase